MQRGALNSMVKIKDINRVGGFIEAKYTPEDSHEEGYVKIRVSDGEVISKKITSLDGTIGFYFTHVRNALVELIGEEDLPKERVVMWY